MSYPKFNLSRIAGGVALSLSADGRGVTILEAVCNLWMWRTLTLEVSCVFYDSLELVYLDL